MLMVILTLMMVIPVYGQGSLASEAVTGPYFLLTDERYRPEHFSLLSNHVEVNITGPVADVRVTQTYLNSAELPLEAIYVFPGSTRAAIYALSMQIGDRTIVAEVQPKDLARAQYDAAKSDGKRTTLLEQDRPNVFRMQVANIPPGETMQVHLQYHELMVPEQQTYTFVYPTVVGPRYVSDQTDAADDSYVSNPYLNASAPSPYQFSLRAEIQQAIPIAGVHTAGPDCVVAFQDSHSVHIDLPVDARGGREDVIIQFQLGGEGIGSGLLTHQTEEGGYFLAMIEPPAIEAERQLLPREYIFVVDVSGSMHGFPLQTTRVLLKDLLSSLKEWDRFNLVLFAGSSRKFSEASVQATAQTLADAMAMFDQEGGYGGTELLPALQSIWDMPPSDDHKARSVIVITDGYVTVEQEAFQQIHQHLGAANLFAFGIGASVNRHLIEGMAHAGGGEAFVVTEESAAPGVVQRFTNYVRAPLLTDIKVQFEGVEVYDLISEHLPDLMAERPLYIMGKYSGIAEGTITVKGASASGPYEKVMSFESDDESLPALSLLWGRERIRTLHDFNRLIETPEQVQAITALGMKYHLLTDYTSFIAIDEHRIQTDSGLITARQVLPMPANVSDFAIGFDMEVEAVVQAGVVTEAKDWIPVVISGASANKRRQIEQILADHWDCFDEHDWQLLEGRVLQLYFNKEGTLEMLIKQDKMSREIEQLLNRLKQRWNELFKDQIIDVQIVGI